MTNMIKTPLGQYINPDKIYAIYIAENGLLQQVGQPPKTIETIPSTGFWIETIYTDNSKQTLSLDYETKEEAQKELDNMMGPAPGNYFNSDYIKSSDTTLKRTVDDNSYKELFYYCKEWHTAINGSNNKLKSFNSFTEAFKDFNSPDI